MPNSNQGIPMPNLEQKMSSQIRNLLNKTTVREDMDEKEGAEFSATVLEQLLAEYEMVLEEAQYLN